MVKRGQVTIFIIIAVMLLGAIGAFVFLRGPGFSGNNFEGSSLEKFIDSCGEYAAEESVYQFSRQGGYFDFSE